MTIRIESMYIAPVKSLALQAIERARLEKSGIAGDRAFYIIDERGRLFTQRDHPSLVQIRAEYDVARDVLTLLFPDGGRVEGVPEPGDPVETAFWDDRPVAGCIAKGGFGDALSAFARRPLRLVRPDTRGAAFDGYPISVCSMESIGALARAADRESVDGRRFRQNIYIAGTVPHGEDEWLGSGVRIGSAVLSVKQRDARCVITTRSPDTGEHDLDTLKVIASYRRDQPKEVNFGLYATVIEPGDAAIGDEVAPIP